jgi:hypothetical protein
MIGEDMSLRAAAIHEAGHAAADIVRGPGVAAMAVDAETGTGWCKARRKNYRFNWSFSAI